ncbi:ABC transporter ATP-binding protein [Butyricimonas hominis]|nr:ABC transporter ATP-binding protein [Butyricimonas hominis]
MMNDSVLRVSGLKKSFRKGKEELQVLKGIDMEICAGEVIGYLGSNGAGKSTTVKIMCGLMEEYAGEVNVLGYDLRKNDIEIKKRIGYIPENAIMYEHLTPMEYLEFIGTLYGLERADVVKKVEELLLLFEMRDNANERMLSFSKGMKQKIHIISGLLHNPEVIFMDEPLNGLDANAVIIVKEMIARLAKEGKTIFYCSHLMDVVEKIATRVILLNEGKIIANGTVHELMEQAGVGSLESLFTSLIGASGQVVQAERMVDVFENKEQ